MIYFSEYLVKTILLSKLFILKPWPFQFKRKNPFAKVTVHYVIANLAEDSDDDKEVFDHDDCEAICYVDDDYI